MFVLPFLFIIIKKDVIGALCASTSNPSCSDILINSPLETLDPAVLSFIILLLNNILYLNIIISYLLFVLLLMFTGKIVLDSNINLSVLNKYHFGTQIIYILNKLISFSKSSSNLWIYGIILSSILFSMTSSFVIYTILHEYLI
jgi:hypothetical protein